jgi:hypothetical protein
MMMSIGMMSNVSPIHWNRLLPVFRSVNPLKWSRKGMFALDKR